MNDNGNKPAYPIADPKGEFPPEGGLTKREEFAKAAMEGLLKDGWAERIVNEEPGEKAYSTLIAKASVIMADQLLKQLSTPQP